MPSKTVSGRAIVIGASMGGLLAARALSQHFKEVVVFERDLLPQEIEHRRGVPQGRHTHGLLASGREAIEKLFPGFSQELVEAGAVPGDVVNESRWYFEGAPLARCKSGLDGLLLSRPMLEGYVRRRVKAIPNIFFREGVTVDSLTTDAAKAE